MTFRKKYFLLAVLLFIIEVVIALYMRDRFVRPYAGDFLVVIFIYCLGRSLLKVPVPAAALSTLAIAYLIEFLQHLQLIDKLGLRRSTIANMVLGNMFEWLDIVAYTLGIAFVLLVETMMINRHKQVNIV